jgi:ribosomal RNA-processing protein 36
MSDNEEWSEEEQEPNSEDEQAQLLENRLKEELANVSFDRLMEIKSELGAKEFNRIIGKNKDSKKSATGKDGKKEVEFKRLSKNAPAEFSSKKQVGRRRLVIIPDGDSGVKKNAVRDPRFEETSGTFDQTLFKRSYGFIDELKTKEIADLKTRISSTKDVNEKAKLEKLHQKIESRQFSEQRTEKRAELKRKWKKEERAKVEQGQKKRFYLKTCMISSLIPCS